MAAYEYHFVNEYVSSRDEDIVYTVYVRVDRRIASPQERVERALLTCSCPGWTRRCAGGTDASRTCKHIRAEQAALARFKANGGRLVPPTATAPVAPTASFAAPPVTQPVAGMVFDQPLPTKRSRWVGLLVLKS